VQTYQSLYAIYSPILSAGKSGVLSLSHAYLDDSARLVINCGGIVNAWTRGKKGYAALKEILGWVSFHSRFSLGAPVTSVQSAPVDTCRILTLALKTEKTILKILPRIPDSDVRVQIDLDVDAYGRLLELHDGYRDLADKLFDPLSIREIVCKSGLSELHVFYRVHQLLAAGIAILVL
jgi:hypothetical protein